MFWLPLPAWAERRLGRWVFIGKTICLLTPALSSFGGREGANQNGFKVYPNYAAREMNLQIGAGRRK
jgi:hypothetical protein